VLGFQRTGLAIFLMTELAVAQFRRSRGWDVGLEARLVGGNAGLTDTTSLGTLIGPAYAITFDERGLLLSLALEGMKVTPLEAG
jgi:lipid-binding SYLF domain-containing protein